MTLIKSISGIRGTVGGAQAGNLTPPDVVKFTTAYARLAARRWLMIQVRVAQQSAVSVRIAGAAPVRVDVTGTAVVSAPEYSGPYDITPLFTAQVLPTAKKLMQKDVTIRKIPQYEVSNDSSGYTLIIGDEYYNAQ